MLSMDATAPSIPIPASTWRTWTQWCAWAGVALLEGLCISWTAAALSIDASAPTWLVLVWVVACGTLLHWLRPRWLGHGLFVLAFLELLAWWFQIEPRNDRPWLADVARLPTMEIAGDQLTVHNLHNFDYRSDTDYTPRWEERQYDLARLRGVDVFLCDWGAPGIVHTLLSWDFEGSKPLAISIETRKEQGESYSALRGFFRQYELYYVVADERDVIRVRTNCRGESVHRYRLNASIPRARALLLGYAQRINQLASEPAWYNALTTNCTTTIRLHVNELGFHERANWRLYANKYSDELLYMRGALDTTLPFEELKRQSDITDAARAAGDDPDFSKLIRRL